MIVVFILFTLLLRLVLIGRAMLSKSLLPFSVDGRVCVPSLLFGLRPNCPPRPPLETPGHLQASLTQSLVETLLLSPDSWCTQGFVCALQEEASVMFQYFILLGNDLAI